MDGTGAPSHRRPPPCLPLARRVAARATRAATGTQTRSPRRAAVVFAETERREITILPRADGQGMNPNSSAACRPPGLASTAPARCVACKMAPGSPSRPPGSPSRPDVPYPSRYARRPSAAQLEETIAEQSDLLTWITTGIFILSLFSSIVRSDPTMPICLFGFYGAPSALTDHMRQCLHLSHRTRLPPLASVAGAHVRSEGAIRSFWVFLSLSLLVDCVWVYKSSGLTPFTWEQLEQMQRQARAPGKPCTHVTAASPHARAATEPARCGARGQAQIAVALTVLTCFTSSWSSQSASGCSWSS